MIAPGRALLDWGWAGTALEGPVSGDAHVVADFEGGVLVAVIDGLGHGPEAAAAAAAAVRVLEEDAGEAIPVLVERCHEALRRTRGAVMSLASFDARTSRMTWGGVGNVEAVLLRARGAPRESIALRGGIVGFHLPGVPASTVPVSEGDTLIMATDGIRGVVGDGVGPGGAPRGIAEAILTRQGRRTDDALVLVARWRGEGHSPAGGPP